MAILAGISVLSPARSAPPTPTTLRESAEERNRRLFLENSRWLDNTRADIFRTTLVKSGERCDSVERATMKETGVWAVLCAPGHAYSFRFDEQGTLLEARRLR